MNVRKMFSAACLCLLFMNGQAVEPVSHKGNIQNTSGKEYLEDWEEGYMDIHQISTGRGNAAFLIFPDGTTMLVDAGDQGDTSNFEWEIMPSVPDTSKTPAEWIVRYIKHFSKPLKNDGNLDYAFITHFDCDHIGTDDTLAISKPGLNYKLQGITHVDYLLNISTLIDRGYPKYDNPSVEAIERTHRYLTNYKKFMASRTALGKKNEMVKVGSSSQISMLKNPEKYADFKVRNIVGNGEIWTGTGEQSEKFDLPRFKENDWSAGVRISYGKFDWFSAGDIFSEKFEEAVARKSGETDVVVCNHHGYSDAMHSGFVKLMAPQAFVVPTWDLHHPQPNTLANMLNTKLYPGKREVYAAGMVASNRKRLGENGKKINPDGHVVIRVYDKGDTFQFFVLNDRSTDYEIVYKSDMKKSK